MITGVGVEFFFKVLAAKFWCPFQGMVNLGETLRFKDWQNLGTSYLICFKPPKYIIWPYLKLL